MLATTAGVPALDVVERARVFAGHFDLVGRAADRPCGTVALPGGRATASAQGNDKEDEDGAHQALFVSWRN